jgi:hypothetical protein
LISQSRGLGDVYKRQVSHLAVSPKFNTNAYRSTRLVVMPEWQGAGVGTRFLNWVGAYHKAGNGRCGKKLPTYFHTSHPQLCQFLKRSPDWKQVSAALFGVNKSASRKSIVKSGGVVTSTGYGGHFRAIQGYKYIGPALT